MSSAPSSPFTASSSSASVSVKNTTLPVTHRMKFILVGDPAVGKSSFRECLRDTPTDIANMTPTIGCDFCLLHYVNTDLRQHVEVFLWDVAGNSRAGSITNDYLRDASGVICIFDLTRRETLYSIKDDWLPRVIEKNIHVIDEQESHLEAKHGAALNTLPDHAVQHALEFAMIGNKRDLESERKISTEEAVQLITQQWHIPYIELSCVADQKDKSMFFDPISCLVKLLMSNPYIERRSRQVVVDRERTRAQQTLKSKDCVSLDMMQIPVTEATIATIVDVNMGSKYYSAQAPVFLRNFVSTTPAVWRCVGLFATYAARDEPYAILVASKRHVGMLAVRVSALCPLVPWILCPLFEHLLKLSDAPDARGLYTVETIIGAPDFSRELWPNTRKIKQHRNKQLPKKKRDKTTKPTAVLARGLNTGVSIDEIARIYMFSCALPQKGGTEAWRWSPKSSPIRCQLVASFDSDPLGRWCKTPDMCERSADPNSNPQVVMAAPGIVLFRTTPSEFWKAHDALYKITTKRALAALEKFQFRGISGSALIEATRSARKAKGVMPLVTIQEAIIAWEQEPTRSIIGAYAFLCAQNAMRPMTPQAELTRETLPLPPPAIETPDEAYWVSASASARTDGELPLLSDMLPILTRASTRAVHNRGVLDLYACLPPVITDQIGIELAVNAVLAFCVIQLRNSGSTARTLPLAQLLTDTNNYVLSKILGAGTSIESWLYGTAAVNYARVRPDRVLESLVKRASLLTITDTFPYIFRVPLPNASERLVVIASPVVFFREQECMAHVSALASEGRIEVLSLAPADMGGFAAVNATVALMRAHALLRATVIVTPYAVQRRVQHFARAMGFLDDDSHTEELRELQLAMLSVSTCTKTGTVRFEGDCNLLIVDTAHAFDVRDLCDILGMMRKRAHFRVILIGAFPMLPMDPNVLGAAFRDMVRAFPHILMRDCPHLAPETRTEEAALLSIALAHWRTHHGDVPLFTLIQPQYVPHDALRIVPSSKERLPYTATPDRFRRSHAVLADDSGGNGMCVYAINWSDLGWMSRHELLTLLSYGNPLLIVAEKGEARHVPFPSHVVQSEDHPETCASVIAPVFANARFDTFRSTSWELIGRHGVEGAAPFTDPNLVKLCVHCAPVMAHGL